MKKAISLFLSLLLFLSMVACGDVSETESNNNGYDESIVILPDEGTEESAESSSDEGEETRETASESENSAEIQVDEGLFNVDITLAASFFEDQTEEEIKAKAQENGYKDCKINVDGSVTYTMSKKKHAEMLDMLKVNFDEMISGYLTGEEKVASFVDIKHDENYSKFDIYVNAELYTAWDSLYVLAFYIAGAYYQAFEGVALDEIDVVVNFIDSVTNEVLNTASYKNFASNASGETTDDGGEGVATEVAEKETICITDVCEFYVDYTDITNDVVPPQPGSWYSHYVADDGKVYVDICIAYKNLETKECNADEIMEATLFYGGKYQYSGFSTIEESNRGDFTYSSITNIAPLTTEYLHYLFEVPVEVEESGNTIEIEFVICGNTYSHKVR